MERSHSGEIGLVNGRSGSSRKGKKGNQQKPKQPQRGLGVAQLEKIRLHNQMMAGNIHSNLNKKDERENTALQPSSCFTTSSASLFGVHPNTMMEFVDNERGGKYEEFPSNAIASNILLPHRYPGPPLTLPLLDHSMEGWGQHDTCYSTGSISMNMDSSNSQLDLDLKL